MKNIIKQICVNSFVVILCVVTVLAVFGQTKSDKKREDFQNQQRVINLSFYKNNIKSLEDAPMRCFVRKQIVEFIFAKKVKTQYELAEDLAIDCLEDVKNNPKQFDSSSSFTGQFIYLLKANSPDLAKKIEPKYSKNKGFSDSTDFFEAENAKDTSSLINRLIARIQKGDIPQDISYTIETVRKKNPESTNTLLDSLLKYYENLPVTVNFNDDLFYIGHEFLEQSTPIEIKKRYLFFVIRLGQKAISADAKSKLFSTGRGLLGGALPTIKQILPDSYQQALAIYATLESKESEADKEEREIYKRIEESDNKLEQTVIEAEATDNRNLQFSLWIKAAKLALEEDKFQLSVDYIIRLNSPMEKFNKLYKIQFLTTDILPSALKKKDFESADYVVENTEDLNGKSVGLIKISSEYLNLKNETLALEKLNEALRVLDKTEDDIHKVRNMLSAAKLATKISNADPFEITNSVIKVINKISSPDAKDLSETDSRNQFVDKILMVNAYNLDNAFKILAERDVDFAYPISQGIQRKDLKLVAEVVIEMHKVYPYTPQKEKEVQK